MNPIGTVESLWRYPVKSMGGEELAEAFIGYPGVYGDRLFAFHSSTDRKGLPFLTAREQVQMLRYRPRFREAGGAMAPPNLLEAESMGANPLYAAPADLLIDVETPDGKTIALDDEALVTQLRRGLVDKHDLTLRRSERALTDCRPISLISLQTVRQLGEEIGAVVDKRRFRANIYLDLTIGSGFAEDELVGRRLRLGSKVILSLLERDSRCMMITLDPDTAEKMPALLKAVAQIHGGMAGIYAAVLVEGIVRSGDAVELLD